MLNSVILNIDIVQHIHCPDPPIVPEQSCGQGSDTSITRTSDPSVHRMATPYPPPSGPYPPMPPSSGPGGDFSNSAYPPAPSPGFNAGYPPPMPQQQQQSGAPTAPPITELGNLPVGYEGSGYERTAVPPPAFYPDLTDDAGTASNNPFIVPEISEAEVFEALRQHVDDKCCWGSGAIDKIKIRKIDMSSSYHYHLDTFTEARETAWTFEPYNPVAGGHVPPPGGYGYGGMPAAPEPWSIDVRPDKDWKDSEKKMEVPNTSIIRRCHGHCMGTGRMRCGNCEGRGNVQCTWCNGTGQRGNDAGVSERCTSCDQGSGRRKCTDCSGDGMKTCDLCKGFANVRYFIELHVKWDNHDSDCVSDTSGLKNKYIEKAKGNIAVNDEGPRIQPLSTFPDSRIAQESQQLIHKHTTSYPMERILKMRQTVKVVPVATVDYDYNEGSQIGSFFVYGSKEDRDVYFKDYPNRVCCCCSIA